MSAVDAARSGWTRLGRWLAVIAGVAAVCGLARVQGGPVEDGVIVVAVLGLLPMALLVLLLRRVVIPLASKFGPGPVGPGGGVSPLHGALGRGTFWSIVVYPVTIGFMVVYYGLLVLLLHFLGR